MKYLLDTNICVYIINNRPDSVLRKLKEVEISEIVISSITVAELYFGAQKSSKQLENITYLNNFLLPFEIVNFDSSDAFVWGRVRNELQKAGTPIGPMDLLIASQAISKDLILVSNNTREFQRVMNLKLENWV